ncbi:MAG: FecR domain-containing protein, partial [Elusimicrobiota bacterium]
VETIAVGPNSRVMLPALPVNGNTQVLQTVGTALYQIGKQKAPHFQVDTPYLAAVVKGTTFTVSVSEGVASVDVSEGLVEVATPDGAHSAYVRPGFTGYVQRSQRDTVVVVPTTDGSTPGLSPKDGAGKAMQLASRLQPFGVPIVALDFPGAPDGFGRHYPGLAKSFGREGAARIMENIIRMNYNGLRLPPQLKGLKPRFLLEAIPEILEVKKAHYKIFRSAFPDLKIRSVTSGFPSSELGVGIAHPAFPHEISKVWECVEPEPSAITRLFWALGMIPVPVSDNWSFVLDVLFCGATLAGLKYHQASNMPYWKIDKYFRKLLGANPFRAHDAIGARGANFLTWSCLHHLSGQYGELFEPNADLNERKDTGQEYYPLNHFRPLVNWSLGRAEEEDFKIRILGPLFQMTSLILHEKRSHLAQVNAIGELCAQFRRGILS